jgi:hypothetical protein
VDAAWAEWSGEKVVWVGADEMNRKKGHHYLTVFVDLEAKRVLPESPCSPLSLANWRYRSTDTHYKRRRSSMILQQTEATVERVADPSPFVCVLQLIYGKSQIALLQRPSNIMRVRFGMKLAKSAL